MMMIERRREVFEASELTQKGMVGWTESNVRLPTKALLSVNDLNVCSPRKNGDRRTAKPPNAAWPILVQ
jgi:hypothetical protein